MAPELQENGEQHEVAAWGNDNEGNGAAKEIQHSDQEHQDPDLSHDQASHGDQQDQQDQQNQQQQQQEQEGDEEEEEEDDDDQYEEEADAGALADAEAHAMSEVSEDGEEAEYDPESISMTPALQTEDATPVVAAAAAAPNPAVTKPTKPKKSGGFLVGDSDDEDEARDSNPTAQAGPLLTAAKQRQQSPTNIPSPAQGQAARVTEGDVAIAAPASTVAAAAVGAPPASDLAASLEERVKEDPRGEMDAWLGLIAEYRRLNQLDALRQVYDRFIQHFPQAVSRHLALKRRDA